MAADDPHFFSANKIFGGLIFFTAAEVAWGYIGNWLEWGPPLLWGGLIFWAWWKFYLIAAYFMHLKWEGWIVKGLLVPTPIFIFAILMFTNPDVGSNDKLEYGHNGAKLLDLEGHPNKGKVVNMVAYDNTVGEAQH
jgi:cytochrome c oxidase subunit IV